MGINENSQHSPDLIEGKTRVTLAIEEPGGSYGPDAVAAETVAGEKGWLLCSTSTPFASRKSTRRAAWCGLC